MDPANHPAVLSPPEPVPLVDRYAVVARPLKGRSRRTDWTATSGGVDLAIQRHTFVDALRDFFARMDNEVDQYRDDPIATAQALARIDALLGDLRYLRSRLQTVTAEALDALQVRKLTVEGVTTVEATGSYDRGDWQHHPLLTELLTRHLEGSAVIRAAFGDILPVADLAATILEWLRPEWRLTAVRDAGLDPDDYCTVARDDDGRPKRTPSIRVIDNRVKGPTR